MMEITDEIGREIWNKLIEHCGARDWSDWELAGTFTYALREYFTERREKVGRASWPFEWRFQGALGFGGKFRHQDGNGFYVNYYPEDRTSERDARCERMQAWLDERFPEAKRWLR